MVANVRHAVHNKKINNYMSGMANMKTGLFSASDLGASFRETRRALGKTQAQIAGLVGCRRQTIADLEAGKNVEIYTLMSALSALGKGLKIVDSRVDYDQIAEIFNDE